MRSGLSVPKLVVTPISIPARGSYMSQYAWLNQLRSRRSGGNLGFGTAIARSDRQTSFWVCCAGLAGEIELVFMGLIGSGVSVKNQATNPRK